MRWTAIKLWPDNTAYIIGGGPSLRTMAGVGEEEEDKEVVIKGIAAYLEPLLRDKRVIGVNDGYMLGPWVDVCWFSDNRWFMWHRKRLERFPGLKACCAPDCERADLKDIRFIRRGKARGLERSPSLVSWNHNSGGSAVNLALHLGVKRVVLVGFDMRRTNGTEGENNWHNHHKTLGAVEGVYDRFIEGFKHISMEAKELGLEILNASPGSALEMFPVVRLEDVV